MSATDPNSLLNRCKRAFEKGYDDTRMNGVNATFPWGAQEEVLNAWKAGHYVALTDVACEGEFLG